MHQSGPPQHSETTLTPVPALLEQGLRLYARGFRPLLLAALAGALVSALVQTAYQPTTAATQFVWLLVALVPGLVAQAALIWMTWRVYQRRPASPSAAYVAAVAIAPQFVIAGLLVFMVFLLMAFTVFLLPVGLFLAVRISLFAPVLVIENTNIAEAMVRSWRLVEDRWWRTALVALIIFAVGLAPTLAVAPLLAVWDNAVAQVALGTASTAIVLPFAAAISVLLFEDYRRQEKTEDSETSL